MAEPAKGIFIPYHWIEEMRLNDDGVEDQEYSKEVAWYLLKALRAQAREEEIEWPKDRYIKAIVRGYVQQEKVMQKNIQTFTNNKKGGLSDRELDEVIYKLASEGKDAPAIYKILVENYECTHKNHDFIYKRKGWKERKINGIQPKSEEKQNSAESAENSAKYVF